VQEAWGLVPFQPIHVQLRDLSARDYMSGVCVASRVKVYQEDYEGAQYRGEEWVLVESNWFCIVFVVVLNRMI
jgi:hypothetical protein